MPTPGIVIAVRGAALALGCLLLPITAQAVTSADGMIHIIDAANSFPCV